VLYFVISVMGSLLFLVASSEVFCSSLFLQLALLLKLGLAPFQFWVFKVLCTLDISRLCLFLGPIKVGLLWLSVNVVHPSLCLSTLSLVAGLILLWLTSQSHLVLYASGSCQLLILVLLGPSAFSVYLTIYNLALLGIKWVHSGYLSPIFAFLGLGALPPLTIFWAKIFALQSLPFSNGVLLILVSLLRLWPYIRCSVLLLHASHTSLLHGALLILCPLFLVTML